ncbi:MAG: rubredoxin [Planctomycetes bacterium]|nr:rubredoxin [Planctomycetota bacterium]MBM4080725.1 rubredoxin [Planctomycetota bacterium]
MKKWDCAVCGYVCDPQEGDREKGMKPGTPFEKLPKDWGCPGCGAAKDQFKPVEA